MGEVLPQEFYERDTEAVARDLLGKRLVRKLRKDCTEGIIIEAEAYFGLNDPASRAYHGKKNYNKLMWKKPGRVFIYNVHKYWMLNVVAHESNGIGAVLIRAIEPTKGIEVMMRNRQVKKINDLTSGPGKLTVALQIDKSLNGVPATSTESEVYVLNNSMELKIGCSHRVGVKRDLKRKLRFFVENNQFLSRRQV